MGYSQEEYEAYFDCILDDLVIAINAQLHVQAEIIPAWKSPLKIIQLKIGSKLFDLLEQTIDQRSGNYLYFVHITDEDNAFDINFDLITEGEGMGVGGFNFDLEHLKKILKD